MGKDQTLMRRAVIFLLQAYSYLLSPFIGSNCRFEPTCSAYARSAVLSFGVFKGFYLTLCRLLRCHPWHDGGYDPVPTRRVN